MENRQLLSREQITVELKRFGVNCQDRMLTYALRGLGIQPSSHENLERPKRGRRDLYDPLVVWTIASGHRALGGAFHKHADELSDFRYLWGLMRDHESAKLLPEFTQDEEFGAQLLAITSPDLGMDAFGMIRLVHSDPSLLQLCSAGPEFMDLVLTAYKNAVESGSSSRPCLSRSISSRSFRSTTFATGSLSSG